MTDPFILSTIAILALVCFISYRWGMKLTILLVLLPTYAFAKEELNASIPAKVVRVIDGDTVVVDAHPWLDTTINTRVRLMGIDAPEMKSKCEEERIGAIKAKERMESLVGEGDITLTHIKKDKYGGRVVANIILPNGKDVSDIMLKEKLARPYDGSHKKSWCE